MDPRMYFTVEEAAQQMHCCTKTVRTLIKAGALAAHKPAGCRRYLITPEAIQAYVEQKWQPEVIA